jgi:hypothetical protein
VVIDSLDPTPVPVTAPPAPVVAATSATAATGVGPVGAPALATPGVSPASVAAGGVRGVRVGRSSVALVVPASAVSAVAQSRRPLLAGPFRRGASDARAGGRETASRGRAGLEGFGLPRAGSGAAWANPVVASASSRGATGSSRVDGGRRARSVSSTDGGGGLSVPSPFGPPGRGVVAGAGGVASAAAGSGVVAAILVGGLLLLCVQPLRRFRLVPVMAGPVGFVSFQQRPG